MTTPRSASPPDERGAGAVGPSAYECAPCGLVTTALDGTIQQTNRTFTRMTGIAEGRSLVGVRFAELLSGGGRIMYETHLAPLLHVEGSARSIALDLRRFDGGRVRDAAEPGGGARGWSPDTGAHRRVRSDGASPVRT